MTGRLGGGVFQQLLHDIPDVADRMRHGDVTYWWSTCNAICVALPDEPTGGWPPKCETCFPTKEQASG